MEKIVKHTPWGFVDNHEVLAPGIVFYFTPSHGGIRLSKSRQKEIHNYANNFLKTSKWWEEDCDWSIPYRFFYEDIKAYGNETCFGLSHDKMLKHAKDSIDQYHPKCTLSFQA